MHTFFVRHGETNINSLDKLHKKGDLESLNQKGKNQIVLTAKALENKQISTVFCSNEKRAKESAEIVSKILKIPFASVKGFEERNWGRFSDMTWPEIEAKLKRLTFKERYSFIPPKGESWKSCEKRLISALNLAIEESKNKNLLIITHAGAIRILLPHLLGMKREKSYKYNPANASITEFKFEKGIFKKIRVDDTSHL